MTDNKYEDYAIFIEHNLGIEVTQKCNLDCVHCMKGEARNISITKEIAESIFNQVKFVGTIIFTGGEPMLATEEIKMILDVIKEKKVKIIKWSIVTNGTIYNKKLIDILEAFFGKGNGSIIISDDNYHDESIMRIYKENSIDSANPELHPKSRKDALNNMKKLINLDCCQGFRQAPSAIYNVGRATNLTNAKKIIVPPEKHYIYKEGQALAVGPTLTISADGFIVNGNESYDDNDQVKGNSILTCNIAEQLVKKGINTGAKSYEEYAKKKAIIERNIHKLPKKVIDKITRQEIEARELYNEFMSVIKNGGNPRAFLDSLTFNDEEFSNIIHNKR